VKEIKLSADQLVKKLLRLSATETVCFLDSCGVGHLGSHLLIAGIRPLELLELRDDDFEKTLRTFEKRLSDKTTANIFTVSYDFGLKLQNIQKRKKAISSFPEPDIFLATFDCLIIHDYNTGQTFLDGAEKAFDAVERTLLLRSKSANSSTSSNSEISSNFTKAQYISNIEKIQDLIRAGETYQTNLTQQFHANLPDALTPQRIYWSLRKNHPAPFASFIKRKSDFVVSISPERFAKINRKSPSGNRTIMTSPIKGTRPRGKTSEEDTRLKNDLLASKKDLAENTMIVDLLRNDLGRICEFGSVRVDKLCNLEEHPTLFHLVSTVSGELREDTNYAKILKAIFPCGSITGCPKINTMQIIEDLETKDRGLSMGAIGFCGFDQSFDTSVAIRTITIRNQTATFNVGGGIVIDSNADEEYRESLLKAKAILKALSL